MTEQENFWEGEFGNEYTDRNNEIIIKNNVNLFEKILKNISIKTIFEIGCNRGLNFKAIKLIKQDISLNGLEINKYAYDILNGENICDNLYNDTIFNHNNTNKYIQYFLVKYCIINCIL